jgi:phosphoserine phosphatase
VKALAELAPDLHVRPGSGWALVLDADRTLAPLDTGRVIGRELGIHERIRAMFSQRGYTHGAFAEHASIWSEVEPTALSQISERVGNSLEIYDFWLNVLASFDEGPVLVVTAGLPEVWRVALQRHGLGSVPVVGGVHALLDSYFVTPTCKAWVVQQLQAAGYRVAAAGDSEVDLPMLRAADLALWVPDANGSPGLLARLGDVAGVHHVKVDARTFPPLPTVEADKLCSLLAGGTDAL